MFRAYTVKAFLSKLPSGCEHFASQAVMPSELIAILDRYAYEYGESYDSYLATEIDRQFFWSPDSWAGFRSMP